MAASAAEAAATLCRAACDRGEELTDGCKALSGRNGAFIVGVIGVWNEVREIFISATH